jgi:hypothetical protein
MIEFKADEWYYNIPGRGTIALVTLPDPIANLPVKMSLQGETVLIDGKPYLVTGLEFQGRPAGPPGTPSRTVGLVVRSVELPPPRTGFKIQIPEPGHQDIVREIDLEDVKIVGEIDGESHEIRANDFLKLVIHLIKTTEKK